MNDLVDGEFKSEDKMWHILTSGSAGNSELFVITFLLRFNKSSLFELFRIFGVKAIEPAENIPSLLLVNGIASEEYLSFCGDMLFDELSSRLKPAPRWMFEYYRQTL